MQNTSNAALSYCGALVREHDPDRFLLSLFIPAHLREYVWAILAFNHEVSKTREVVSESTLGLIRLQWWRDAIARIYEEDKVLEHEVIKPLAKAIKAHDLPRERFEKLTYAREFDLEDVLPGNLEGLMNYADFTTTPLYELIVQVTGQDPAQEVIQPIAINYALAGILRGTRNFVRQGKYLFPEDMMKKYGVTKGSVFEEQGQQDLRDLVKAIATQKLARTKPRHPFLKGCEVLSEIYFSQISRLSYDVMSPQLQREPAFKALRLLLRTKIL